MKRAVLVVIALAFSGCMCINSAECKKLCSPYAVKNYDSNQGGGSCTCDNATKEDYPERVK